MLRDCLWPANSKQSRPSREANTLLRHSFQTLDDVFGSYCRSQNTFESTRQHISTLVVKKGKAVARLSLALHCNTTISPGETKQVSLNLAEKVGREETNSAFAFCFKGVAFVFLLITKVLLWERGALFFLGLLFFGSATGQGRNKSLPAQALYIGFL